MADDGFRDRMSKQGEEALGKLASDLLENPLINSAITRAFSAREKAVQAQEAAMGALNLPSAAALVERLSALERQLSKLTHDVSHVSDAIDAVPPPVPREQERLAVDEAPTAKPAGKRAATNKKSE